VVWELPASVLSPGDRRYAADLRVAAGGNLGPQEDRGKLR